MSALQLIFKGISCNSLFLHLPFFNCIFLSHLKYSFQIERELFVGILEPEGHPQTLSRRELRSHTLKTYL